VLLLHGWPYDIYSLYEHRTVKGGIGHNLPEEAPQAFATAVVNVAQV
jgi:hypothetical protein